jgi:hypothetical protein
VAFPVQNPVAGLALKILPKICQKVLMQSFINIEDTQVIHSGEGGRLLSSDASFTHKYKPEKVKK